MLEAVHKKKADKKDRPDHTLPSAPSPTSPAGDHNGPLTSQPPSPLRTKHLGMKQREEIRKLRVQCGQLCVAVFLDEQRAVRSLGFTSSIDGEGKSFLAQLAAVVTATDHGLPVTLLECSWAHRCFEEMFELEQGPGLAEWIRGECELEAIRQHVSNNLTVIHAGDDKGETIRLLQQLRQRSVLDVLERPGEVLIVDLPSIVTTAYGTLAASIVESLVVVVCMGVTPDADVAETCTRLKDLHVEGMVLNQIKSRIPRWLGANL